MTVEGRPVDWERRGELFSIDPKVAFVNHGSFGAVPLPVQRAQQRLRDEVEANPMAFYSRGLWDRLTHTRRHLAAFIGADPDGTALVANATAAIEAVFGSLDLTSGDEVLLTDHGYGAVRFAAERLSDRTGAAVREVTVPLDADDDQVVARIIGAVQPRTRLVVIDQVTSTTAKLLPVERLVAALHEHGVLVLVDGAHAAGMLPVDVTRIGADFWLGNLHKWALTSRPTALLAVSAEHRPRMRPVVVSWRQPEGFPAAQEYAGTLDYTAWLAAPAGLHLFRALGPERIRTHNNELAAHGQRVVASALAVAYDYGSAAAELELARTNALGDPRVSMRVVPLPPRVATDRPAAMEVRSRLAAEHAVEVALDSWHGHGYVRLSAQLYNRVEDYGRLARALVQVLQAV
jgi:isopenicillin-N epimerase